jgi:hypothetical protein
MATRFLRSTGNRIHCSIRLKKKPRKPVRVPGVAGEVPAVLRGRKREGRQDRPVPNSDGKQDEILRQQGDRFQARARSADAKIVRTKNKVLYFLATRGLKKIEGREFSLRLQKNSQDSVEITDESQVPMSCRELELRVSGKIWQAVHTLLPEDASMALKSCVREQRPSNDAIKEAACRCEEVPGAQVRRGIYLRVA